MSEPSINYSWHDKLRDQIQDVLDDIKEEAYAAGKDDTSFLPSKDTSDIIAMLDEHYISKGEAITNSDGELLKVSIELAGGVNNITVHVVNPKNVGDYRKALDAIKDLFDGHRSYTEVEQRCIEAQLEMLQSLIENNFKDNQIEWSALGADVVNAKLRLLNQLSTNNKDTLERSSDDKE
jgi:hypothetical protein